MRRAILAASLGGLLLTGAACDSDADTGANPAPPAAAPPSAPAVALPDYTSDTRRVCGRLEKLIDSDLPAGFGTAIGRMIAQKEAKASADADQSEQAAGARLTSAAAAIRRETATAQDPDLRAAGTASAAKLTAGAADRRFFDGIRTTQDLDRVIETRMGEWLSPITGYCT